MMARAGYRRPESVLAMQGVKVLMPVALVGLVYFTGLYHQSPVFILAFAAIGGYLLPEFWLTARIRSRQQQLRLSLPDCLDLLVVCVEAGLALDQSFMRVTQELRIVHPELCEELDLVNAETRIGRTRMEALRELADRTGVEDIKSLVAMMVQTDRFGTSIAQSLRVHSDELRTKRRQRAEEMAAKATVKMIPPLVFCIFPALFVVILGPAVVGLYRHFL
jgi:tight adherence protein C